MNWTDNFPVWDDAMLEAYHASVSEAERAAFGDLFGVASVNGGQASRLTRPMGFQPVVSLVESSTTGRMPAGQETRDVYPPRIVSAALFW